MACLFRFLLLAGKNRKQQVVEDGQLCITAGGASKASGTCGYMYINKGVLEEGEHSHQQSFMRVFALFEDASFVIMKTAGSLWSPANLDNLHVTQGYVASLLTLGCFVTPLQG